MEELHCIGCGSVLQSHDPKKPGFIPSSALAKSDEDIICRRCFRLKHYNEILPIEVTQDDFYEIISNIGETDSLVVMIIDIFDIEGSLIPQINKLTNHNDCVVLVNKRDLLPKSVSERKLLHHLRKILADSNLRPLEIFIMSAKRYHNIDTVMEAISNISGNRDIYVVGATNVGKSTFINTLLKSYAASSNDIITVSEHMGTTLNVIKIPFDHNYIIDTPGIYNDHQIGNYLSPESLKIITPKKEIKPRSFQLNPQQTLFINGFARIDFVEGPWTSFICYFAPMIKIHRTKLSNADDLYKNRRFDVLKYPLQEESFALIPHQLQIPTGKHDLILPGLGFITIIGPAKIIAHVHQKTMPYIREALI
ncbi:ribosome biogenesis GTPase YqeH [Candidatus Xianfuyuplasma coldseepsis]|uniref:Ribosome biogenesis GTPase YqeH n=1 Tax=Candidatus Xianfuyuplasma coldseepsis TaxID=2782163 RepID=A0A7L7KSA9_9MOLU|nr:ribosome biogenesis GTPase YqeH [Xianfuyuplasma coldseepsis]QMS85623.1 ribosome biogenesis GTPase YqeH [Xianfuyuplasma coldseepsis]